MPLLAYVLPARTGELIGAPNAAGFQMWFAYVFPLGRLCDFSAGVFAALLVTSGRFPRVSFPWRAPLLISCVLLIVAAAQRDINIKVMHGPFDSVAMVITYFASALVVSVALAWLMHRYVETPIVRRFSTAGERR
jgi:peptidoglycan/LPS O-acetylase OafA/YrhL